MSSAVLRRGLRPLANLGRRSVSPVPPSQMRAATGARKLPPPGCSAARPIDRAIAKVVSNRIVRKLSAVSAAAGDPPMAQARPTWGAPAAPSSQPAAAAAAHADTAEAEHDSAAQAAVELGRRAGCTLAFASSPRRPPAFACSLVDGKLHVAVAEGADLKWDSGSAPAAVLRGHGEPVGALTFLSTDERTLLASASAADVLLWLGPRRGEGGTEGVAPSYRCVGLLSPVADGLEPAHHVALCCGCGGGDDDDVWFSAAVGREIAVGVVPGSLLSGGGGAVRTHCLLAGHAGAVTATTFVPPAASASAGEPPATPLLLASASEDRTLKLWDLTATAFVYSTPIVSAAPFISLAAHALSGRVAAGSADGKLRLYSLIELGGTWALDCVSTVDLRPKAVALHSAEHQKIVDDTPTESIPVVYSMPTWKCEVSLRSVLDDDGDTGTGDDSILEEVEAGEAAFSIHDAVFSAVAVDINDASTADGSSTGQHVGVRLVGSPVAHVLVATATGVLHINTHNRVCTPLLPFAADIGMARNVVCCTSAPRASDVQSEAYTARERRVRRMLDRPNREPVPEPEQEPPGCIACGVSTAFEPLLAVFTFPVGNDRTRAGGGGGRNSAQTEVDMEALREELQNLRMGELMRRAKTVGVAEEEVMISQDDDDPHRSLLQLVVEATLAEVEADSSGLTFDQDSALGVAMLEGPIGRGLRLSAQCSEGPSQSRSQDRKKGPLMDQPVTFHTRIKSSGYGSPGPNRGGRAAKRGSRSPGSRGRGGGLNVNTAAERRERVNYGHDGPPIEPQPQHTIVGLHNGPISCVTFSADGSRIATSSADTTAHITRLPVSKHKGDAGVTCTGHTGRLSSVAFSSRGDRIITSGDDRSSRLWVVGRAEPALVIDHVDRNKRSDSLTSPSSPGGSGAAAGSSGGTLGGAVLGAQFFHDDRLLLLAAGNTASLYGFSLHRDESDSGSGGGGGRRDDKPRLPQGRYRRAQSYNMVGSPFLTALAAHNVGSGLCSASLVAAGSNKVVEVVDINGHGSKLTIPAAHGRATHCISLGNPEGGGGGGDAFLTAALDGMLKLWDVRDGCTARGQCVMVWSGHTNRVHHVGAALSPCGRFAACGSEDRLAVMYDLRKQTAALHKLRGHSDVVLGVAFSPVHPQLTTVGLDGSLRFFCDR